jgi:transglutaminase superfamily protein/Big-like domain-containing protein
MHKKYISVKMMLIVSFYFFIFNNIICFAQNFTVWISEQVVECDKNWAIKFNMPIDKDTLKNNLFVLDKKENKNISINIDCDEDSSLVNVSPVNKYEEGKTYELILNNNIKSEEGKYLSQPVRYIFTTKISENKVYKPGDKVKSYDDFYEAIKYGLSNFQDNIEITIINYDPQIYSLDIVNKVINDNPTIDFGYASVSAGISYYDYNEVTMSINFTYKFSKQKMLEMKMAVENKVKDIVNEVIKPDMQDYEKELALHDYVVNNSKYDTRLYTNNVPFESYTDYGVLIEGIGVCSSYAKAMHRLLNAVGIESIYVTGEAVNDLGTIGHAWNIVKIAGQYYHLDATWDDPVSADGTQKLSYSYFNVTDDQIGKNHIWDKSKYPECSSAEYNFNNLGIQEKDDDGDTIIVVKNYDEFFNNIEETLKNRQPNISLKVYDYNADVYDLQKTIEHIINTNSDIICYGYGYNYYDEELNRSRYIKINFNY